jgi:hypothetical protein
MKDNCNHIDINWRFEMTNEEYWDCECEEKYIHKKSESSNCSICGAEEDSQPDSIDSEIVEKNLVSGRKLNAKATK